MTVEAIVATLSLLLSCSLAVFYIRDRRHAKYAVESGHTKELLEWHAQVVQLLAKTQHMQPGRNSAEHRADLALLSALIEQGRFFFPNIDKLDGYGAEKPPAYRGYRNLALDFLVACYNLLHESSTPAGSDRLRLLQRHFTSVVFEIVRPKERLETIRSLTDRYFLKNQSFEDFLDHRDGSILEHIWRGPPHS